MLVEWDLRFLPEIHAHKADGKWHFYPEPGRPGGEGVAAGRRGRAARPAGAEAPQGAAPAPGV
jgi:hypothetical protein